MFTRNQITYVQYILKKWKQNTIHKVISKENITPYITKKPLYDVKIDFDEARIEWNKNKTSMGNGTYQYICCAMTKNEKICGRGVKNAEMYCNIHKNYALLNYFDYK
jgi:hypothetical protein